MGVQDDVQLCTFISPHAASSPSGLKVYRKKQRRITNTAKYCCTVCAFREEEFFQNQRLKESKISFFTKCVQYSIDTLVSILLSAPKSSFSRHFYDLSRNLSYCSLFLAGFLFFDTEAFSEVPNDNLKSNDGQLKELLFGMICVSMISTIIVVTKRIINRSDQQSDETSHLIHENKAGSLKYDSAKGVDAKRQDHYSKILSKAIQCKTISYDVEDGNESSMKECQCELKRLHTVLNESFPILYKRHPPRIIAGYSLLFTIPGLNSDAKPIMLCSHLDVVPAPNIEDEDGKRPWVHEPFGGIIENGVIWGRGGK